MIQSIQFLKSSMVLCILGLSSFVVSFKPIEDIRFIEDKGLKSFEQLRRLPQFQNKVVYIDVWGTRCIPCIEEFAFSNALKDSFQNQPIEYLYLAVNYKHPDDEERWRKMAKEKNLTGYHVLSNDLYMDTWKTIKDSIKEMYLIPHYLILDKEGRIAFGDAERPSAKDKLYRQLRSVLDK